MRLTEKGYLRKQPKEEEDPADTMQVACFQAADKVGFYSDPNPTFEEKIGS